MSMLTFTRLILAWSLFVSVQAFSTDETGGARLPSKFIDVTGLDIQPPGVNSELWTVTVSTALEEIKLIVGEHWHFKDEEVHSRATKGHSYLSDGESWQQSGWSRLVINSDAVEHTARGSFEMLGAIWHLSEHPDRGHIIWRESALAEPRLNGAELSAQQEVLTPRAEPSLNLTPLSRSLISTLGNTAGCPTTPQVARIGVLGDMNFMRTFNSTVEARTHIVDTINKASQVWEKAFNISLELGDLILANDSYQAGWNSQCSGSNNDVDALQTRLNAVSTWRSRSASRRADGNAQWTLFTDCPSGNVVGLAWESTACNASAANVIHHSLLDYRVLAHETGHVFGAVHDCTSTTCAQNGQENQSDTTASGSACCPLSANSCDAGGQYIMNPSSNLQQFEFSPCSQGNVCSGLGSGAIDAFCLTPRGSNTTNPGSNTTQPGPNNTTEPRTSCSSNMPWERFRSCQQDLQCVETTGQQDSYACGNPESCLMWCYDTEKSQCIEQSHPFNDRTPCGDDSLNAKICMRGRCGFRRPTQQQPSRGLATWIWVLILVLSIAAALALLGILLLVRCHRRGAQSAAARQVPEKRGFPDIYEQEMYNQRNLGTVCKLGAATHKPSTASDSSTYKTAGSDYLLNNSHTKYGEVSSPKSVFTSELRK